MAVNEEFSKLPDIDYLKSILCARDDGFFIWRRRSDDMFSQPRHATAWNARYAGNIAGSERAPRKGIASYWVISLYHAERMIHLYTHRLVLAFANGQWPDGYVDHIDGNGLNNRISNLRVVSSSVSGRNKPVQKNNKTGIPGVSIDRRGYYRVQAGKEGNVYHLGYFSDFLSAACAKKSFEARNGFHNNHGRLSCSSST